MPAVAGAAEAADLVSGVMLLTGTALFASLFFLLHSRRPSLRAYTWSVLEATASIIVAILLSEVGKDLTYLAWRPHSGCVDSAHLLYAASCTLIMQAAAFWLVHDPSLTPDGVSLRLLRTQGMGPVLARFTGF